MLDVSKLIGSVQNDTIAKLFVRFFYFAQRTLKCTPVVPRSEIDGTTEDLLGFYEKVAYWNMTLDPVRTEAYREAAVCFDGLRTIDLGTGAHLPQAKLALDGGATHVPAIAAKSETAAAPRASVDARAFVPRYQLDVRFEDGETWSRVWRGPAISPVKDDAADA